MGDMTMDFSRVEFTCKCGCGLDTIDFMLIMKLQTFRSRIGKRTTIASGARCRQHNINVKGSKDSQHLHSKAADIIVHGMTSQEVYNALDYQFGKDVSLGLYPTFVHIDVRTPGGKRWLG
jgi:uncharacterized protein YcbK (DUF882 family)